MRNGPPQLTATIDRLDAVSFNISITSEGGNDWASGVIDPSCLLGLFGWYGIPALWT